MADPTAPGAGTRGNVVIIDDSELVIHVLSEALEKQGWNVRTATNGAAGVSEVRRERPDVVISDLHMPEMNGHQVIEAVHRTDRHLPVILLSSDADLQAVLGAVRRGAFDYVLKSDLGNLSAAVQRAIEYAKQIATPEPAGTDDLALMVLEQVVGDLERELASSGEPVAGLVSQLKAVTTQLLS